MTPSQSSRGPCCFPPLLPGRLLWVVSWGDPAEEGRWDGQLSALMAHAVLLRPGPLGIPLTPLRASHTPSLTAPARKLASRLEEGGELESVTHPPYRRDSSLTHVAVYTLSLGQRIWRPFIRLSLFRPQPALMPCTIIPELRPPAGALRSSANTHELQDRSMNPVYTPG